MKIRSKQADLVVAIVYFFTAITICMAAFYMNEFELIHRISNSFFTEKAMVLNISGLDSKDIEGNLMNGNVLFYKEDYNTYRIFFKNEFQIPIISGRFFTSDDLLVSEPKAIVGRDIKTLTESDGKTILLFNDQKYEVIGITGIKKPSWLDGCIYLIIPEEFNTSATLYDQVIIDGIQVENNIRSMQSMYPNLKVSTLENEGIGRVFKTSGTSFYSLFRYVWLVFVISVFSITSYWILQKQKMILILKICGIGRISILNTICVQYAKYALLSFLFGVVISYLFIKYLFSNQFNIFSNLYLLIVGIFCCIIPALMLNLRWASNTMGRYQR